MRHDEIDSPADGLAGRGDSELVGVLGDELRTALKAALFPGEYVVWAGRGRPPRLAPIRVFPSFFAVFLCAASGFALMVLFGIYAERDISLEQKLFLLVLPPAALGCVAALGIANGWGRHRLRRRRISRSFYVLTDSRAIVGRQGRRADDVTTVDWTPTCSMARSAWKAGTPPGDVYFTCDGQVVVPQWGFEGIEQPAQSRR